MKYKKLGNTQEEISSIGLGTTGSGSYSNIDHQKTNQRIKLYQQAVDLGLRYFDTAEIYGGGYAEEVLGKAIKGIRDKVFIASKFNPNNNSFKGIMKSIEGSLKRLNTDYIDLYQVHWPNPLIPVSETMDALERLVKQGKIRYIGVSNFSLDELKDAQIFLKKEQIVSIQVEYNLLDRTIEKKTLPYCMKNRVTVIAYSPLNQGKITWRKEQDSVLYDMAEKYEKSPFQIILNWLILHPPVIALTRVDSFEHLAENISSTSFALDESDQELLNNTFCEHCIYVPTEKIRVNGMDNQPIYTSIQEAIENKLDLIPSPEILAENILQRKAFKPIRLVPSKDPFGRYDYDPVPYDFKGEIKKYWAWLIAYGPNVPIPAYCFNDKSD